VVHDAVDDAVRVTGQIADHGASGGVPRGATRAAWRINRATGQHKRPTGTPIYCKTSSALLPIAEG
jgi:hypothetical protein